MVKADLVRVRNFWRNAHLKHWFFPRADDKTPESEEEEDIVMGFEDAPFELTFFKVCEILFHNYSGYRLTTRFSISSQSAPVF